MFDYFFNRRMPPAPWWLFVGWFYRSLPLPLRRIALRILPALGSGCLFFTKRILFTELGLSICIGLVVLWLS